MIGSLMWAGWVATATMRATTPSRGSRSEAHSSQTIPSRQTVVVWRPHGQKGRVSLALSMRSMTWDWSDMGVMDLQNDIYDTHRIVTLCLPTPDQRRVPVPLHSGSIAERAVSYDVEMAPGR